MACANITLNGLGVGCKDSMGGIKRFYAIESGNVTGFTLDANGTKITTITTTSTTVESETVVSKFSVFEVRRETSNFTSNINSDNATGTFNVSSVISMQFAKNTTQKRSEIMALAKQDLVIVALDQNGKYWVFGYNNPVTCTGGTFQSGTAAADLNGATIELTDISKELPFELDMATFESTLVKAVPVTE